MCEEAKVHYSHEKERCAVCTYRARAGRNDRNPLSHVISDDNVANICTFFEAQPSDLLSSSRICLRCYNILSSWLSAERKSPHKPFDALRCEGAPHISSSNRKRHQPTQTPSGTPRRKNHISVTQSSKKKARCVRSLSGGFSSVQLERGDQNTDTNIISVRTPTTRRQTRRGPDPDTEVHTGEQFKQVTGTNTYLDTHYNEFFENIMKTKPCPSCHSHMAVHSP